MKDRNRSIRYYSIRTVLCLFFAILLYSFFFFKSPGIFMGNLHIDNPIYNFTDKINIKYYIIGYFEFIFSIGILLLLLLLIYARIYKKPFKEDSFENRHPIEDKVMEILFTNRDISENQWAIYVDELTHLAPDRPRQVGLIKILQKIHYQTKGIIREKSDEIIKRLEIEDYVEKYIASPYLQDKIFGLRIISEFRYIQYESRILNWTTHRSPILRSETIVTLLRLNPDKGLWFFNNYKLHLSLWDMNVILRTTDYYEIFSINYQELIQSDNPKISALGILLANKHRKIEFRDLIRNKLDSNDNWLNEQAYSAFITMMTSENDFLILAEKFEYQNAKVKRLITKSFVECPDITFAKYFLSEVIENESVILKVEAMKQLAVLDINKVSTYMHTDNLLIKKAHDEISDLNLN